MLNEIVFLLGFAFASHHSDHPFATATLSAVAGNKRALDETVVGQRDNHTLIRDQVLDGDLALSRHDLGAARRTILPLNFAQFVRDDFQHPRLLGDDIKQILDRINQGIVLAFDALPFETRQLIEPQIQDVADLLFRELIVAIRR